MRGHRSKGRRLLSTAALASLATGAAFAGTVGTTAGAAATTVTLVHQVVAGLSADTDLGAVDRNQQVEVAVTLHKDLTALQKAEAALYDPKSPNYHHFLTPMQWNALYSARPQQLSAVRDFVTSHGMQLGNPDVLHDYVLAIGTAAQAEQTFGVSLHNYKDSSGNTFYANPIGATVPMSLGIDGVLGLESKDRLHTHQSSRSGPIASQPQCIPPNPPTCTGILQAQDLWSVYNQPSNNFGEGQTMGIIGEGQTADVIAALREFETTRGLPSVPVQVYHVDPADGPTTQESSRDDAGRVEWELDTQASTGMAPHVKQIRLYFGTSLQLTQLSLALQTWANDPDGPLQVSASLGACEDTPATDSLFGPSQRASMAATIQAAMEGRTLFASTGDTGAGCSVVVSENGVQYGPIPGPEYPSIDANAVGVGGTVVYTDGGTPAMRVSERAWDHTGGAPSPYIAQPSYQTGVQVLGGNTCIAQMDGQPFPPGQLCRGVSDVAALSGDVTIILDHRLPHGTVSANGYDMVDCSGPANNVCSTYNDHFSEGGTSLSSPLWLGMWARVQAHHDAGNASAGSLGFANNVIYPLAKDCVTGPRDFFDIALTNPPGTGNPFPTIARTPCVNGLQTDGWDYPTGWGSPDVTNLTKDASGNTTTDPISNVPPCGPPTCPDPPPIFAKPPGLPNCNFAFFDASADAAGLTGGQLNQLDITEGDFGLTTDHLSLRTVLTITDLSTTIPNGSNVMDYQFLWTFNGTNYGTQAEVTANPPGNPTIALSDGTWTFDPTSGTYNYTASATSHATGPPFVLGPGGKVEVDAPLADIGSPTTGSILAGSLGLTAASGGAPGGPSFGFIADLDGPGHPYTLGSRTCLDGPNPDVPEVPLSALLVLAGGGTVLTSTWIYRRRRQSSVA